jgi:hypothetical protein
MLETVNHGNYATTTLWLDGVVIKVLGVLTLVQRQGGAFGLRGSSCFKPSIINERVSTLPV